MYNKRGNPLKHNKMKTIKINNQAELSAYKSSGEVCNLEFQEWEGGGINLRCATTGSINLRCATTGNIDLICATTGNIDLEGAKTGNIYLEGATTGDIFQNYTESDKELLRSIPMDQLEMANWHGDDKWLKCKSMDEINACGTTFCIRGWAEVRYLLETGEVHPNPSELIPKLKHLFYMTNDQAKAEIAKILAD